MARVISVCNQKGGVGKTTTCVNLGAYLAVKGRKVLLVDFDPQANASSALGHDHTKDYPTIYHGISGEVEYDHLVRPSQIFGYHFIPSAPHLAGALIELIDVPGCEWLLRRFINGLRHKYDYVLIDLPPSLSLLTVNGLVASDEVLIPVQSEYYSLESLGQLLETINLTKHNLHHRLNIAGVVLAMYNKGEHLSREVAKNLRRHFPYKVFEVEIPRITAPAEAPSFSKPILLYRPDSAGALAYRRLADEILAQEKNLRPKEPVFASKDFGNFHI